MCSCANKILPTLQQSQMAEAGQVSLDSIENWPFGHFCSLFRLSQLWIGFNSCCSCFGFKNYCSSFGFSSSCCSCHVQVLEQITWRKLPEKNISWIKLSWVLLVVLYTRQRVKMMWGILQLEISFESTPTSSACGWFLSHAGNGVLSVMVKGPRSRPEMKILFNFHHSL